MKRKRIPEVATYLDLAVLYGIRKRRYSSRMEQWMDEHLEDTACIIGLLVMLGVFVYLLILWGKGVI